MNRIAVWGGSFWMVLFLFCLPALEVLPVWKIIVYHYGWKVRENSSLRLTAGEISWCSIKP